MVTITPTYSGCPAMDAIREAIVGSLPEREVAVRTVHTPAWTTDWMSAEGRRKLEEYGIGPSIARPRGALPPLSGGGRPNRFLLRLHCLQGADGVLQLRRAVRSLQGAVSWGRPLPPCCV